MQPDNSINSTIAVNPVCAQDAALSEDRSGLEQHFEEILQKMTDIMEQELHIQVRKDTFNYARFATHVQYLLKRLFEHQHIDSSNLALCQSVRDEYPEIADCVDRICDYYKNDWALDLHEEERLYLMLHVNRACSKEAI